MPFLCPSSSSFSSSSSSSSSSVFRSLWLSPHKNGVWRKRRGKEKNSLKRREEREREEGEGGNQKRFFTAPPSTATGSGIGPEAATRDEKRE